MELRMTNRDLKSTVKSNFKKDSVPNICNTKLFYALYFPNRAGEFFKLLIAFVICFIAIPIATYFLIPDHKQWYLIAIYIIAVIIFCGLYVMVGNHTKVKHLKALIEGRTIHNEILSNKRKIQARIKLINRDKNEDIYKLDTFDDEISHIKQDLTDISIKKQEALNTFETVTKNIISDELTNNVKVRMDKLIENHNLIKSQLDEVSVARKTKNLYIIDNYEVYIGKEFMSVDKIDALANIMNHSTVTNISEAIEEYRNKLDE